jgi:hypothetical protein
MEYNEIKKNIKNSSKVVFKLGLIYEVDLEK